uniref:Uncharacterized protein n=1 Tax=Anguilla anguilla TaxID=7936 RepID=A0A0E9VZ02_ANGAN
MPSVHGVLIPDTIPGLRGRSYIPNANSRQAKSIRLPGV